MHSRLFSLVQKTRPLFWSIGENHLQDLDDAAVVETILNFGNLEQVRRLFDILGTEQVADIFYSQLSAKRHNYYPQVSHYFDQYFKRHVQKYS